MDKAFINYPVVMKVIGLLQLAAGIFSGLLATAEMYCFYLFSPGGRLHYEGFSFGSFMFGLIAAQNIAFYLIAAILVPLGYGHLTKKKWVGKVSVALLSSWLIVGIPVIIIALFMLVGAKALTVAMAILAMILCGLFYLPIPVLLIRFIRARDCQLLSLMKIRVGMDLRQSPLQF